MRIVRVQLHEVTLPLRHAFETSSHRKSALSHIVVQVTDDSGIEGWGEIASPTDPFYCSETTVNAWNIAESYLVPAILGYEWDEPRAAEAAWSKIRGNEFAKAGFSAALWSAWAQARGVSLAQAIGGTRQVVEAGVSLGIEHTIDDLLAQIDLHVASGYRRVKLKIAPGWDVEPVAAARQAYPDLALHVDANGAYTADRDTIDHLKQLDHYGLTMVEQPFEPRDFCGHRDLQQHIATPICLDETIVTNADLDTMLALDAGRVVNIKVSRMGGLANAVSAHWRAYDAGVPVWCGGMHEYGVGRAANIALSSLPGFTLPSDVSGSDKYYAHDIVTPPIRADHGLVDVPNTPGLGFAIDHAWLEANRHRYADLSLEQCATLVP